MDMNDILSGDSKFRYMLLSRMQTDCDYYLGYGNACDRHLWAGNVEDQIEAMKALWNSFPDGKKPEWLSMEQIENYSAEMIERRNERESFSVESEARDMSAAKDAADIKTMHCNSPER